MYDIFIISDRQYFPFLKEIQARFPFIKTAISLTDAQSKSLTEMFWIIWDDLIIDNNFCFDIQIPDWDKDYVHVLKNKNGKQGICLIPKNKEISKKENDYRFFINSKQIDIIASYRGSYNKFKISNYEDYKSAISASKTEMFWGIWTNLEVLDQTIFDLYFDRFDGTYDYDRNENHVWLNSCNGNLKFENGLVLFTKNKVVSKKEIEYKTLIDRKEYDVVISKSQYSKYFIATYEDYLTALEQTKTEMFWGIWTNLEVLDQTIFDLYFDRFDGTYDYDRNENHVWLTLCGKDKSYGNGLVLFSKNKVVSKKEIENKTLINRKEHDKIVAKARYPKYNISTYDEYLTIIEQCLYPLFWCIWNEIIITDESVFDLYYDPFNGLYDFDRNINHAFKNRDVSEDKFNGLMLMSRNKLVPKREIDFRFLVDKKEHNITVSKLRPYDIVFISYNEENAEKNYQLLINKKLENKIYRVHGVKGIHNAHLQAAKLVSTPMFYVVDGDAVIKDEFDFSHLVERYDRYIVHVWQSENPINGLQYGYGGVKLLPTKQTLEMNLNSADMTSSISTGFRVMPYVSNITEFNTDPFSTWRSAFRECVKLSSKIILGQINEETENRLQIWCNTVSTAAYSEYAKAGALAGKEYGTKNSQNIAALNKINDFDWLKNQFELSSDINGKILEITSAQALATS